jgi:hypothetical protein
VRTEGRESRSEHSGATASLRIRVGAGADADSRRYGPLHRRSMACGSSSEFRTAANELPNGRSRPARRPSWSRRRGRSSSSARTRTHAEGGQPLTPSARRLNSASDASFRRPFPYAKRAEVRRAGPSESGFRLRPQCREDGPTSPTRRSGSSSRRWVLHTTRPEAFRLFRCARRHRRYSLGEGRRAACQSSGSITR